MPEAPTTTGNATNAGTLNVITPPNPPTKTPDLGGGDKDKPKKRNVPAFAFAVEIAGSKNENVLCPLDNMTWRGRWSRKNLLGRPIDENFAPMPDLPGLCLIVNTARGIVKRFDPLTDPENAKILKRAQRIILGMFNIRMTPERPKQWKGLSADNNTIKTFCFWVLRLRDAKLVNVIKGRIPEWEEIQTLPGVVQLKQFDQLAGVIRGTPDDAIRYVRPVEDEEESSSDEMYMEELAEPVINPENGGGRFGDDDD